MKPSVHLTTRPLQGGGADPIFTHVDGQLYAATPNLVTDPDDIFGSGSVASINRKLMATAASCGSHPLIDVSAPGSTISSGSDASYTYCIARVNGECAPKSSAGQVFVNCPGVIWSRCTGSGIHGGTPSGVGNDICVSNMGAAANTVRQFSLDRTDFAGAYTRTLVSATSRLRMVTGFENNRLLPDNSWLLFRAEWLNYDREEMWMAKMPPYPASDDIDRGAFVPMVLNLQPPAGAAVDNAVVEFGYTEYAGNCTSRHDACVATASLVGAPGPSILRVKILMAPPALRTAPSPYRPSRNGCFIIRSSIGITRISVVAASPMQAVAVP